MTDFVNAISFVLDVLVASLLPAAVGGIILKVQKRRHVYPRGKEGNEELRRDSNRLVVFFNCIYVVTLLQGWISAAIVSIPPIPSLVKVAVVLFYSAYFYNRPSKVIAIPDDVVAITTLIGESADATLEGSSKYRNWKSRILASTVSREERMLGFSGPEMGIIGRGQQLLLTQTQFKCNSCGLEKDNSHLADILQDEKGQLLYFCDDLSCRLKVRDIYSKLISVWRSERRPTDV